MRNSEFEQLERQPTLHSCCVCGLSVWDTVDAYDTPKAWCKVEYVDGPVKICPKCIADPYDELVGLLAEYPDACVTPLAQLLVNP